jgi:2-methylcitrate dehydratase PrpD|eukprot:COSAG02_NODE_3028_length_7515_cov_4.487325_3_plen_89_part_00
MSPAADVTKASSDLGNAWETMQVAVKPYPSCRYSHAALDGIAQLRSAAGLEVGEKWRGVTDVRIGLPAAVISFAATDYISHTSIEKRG